MAIKENSREEDIKVLEKLEKKEIHIADLPICSNLGVCALNEKEKQAIEHILSDYKRVLKENEKLQEKLLDVLERAKSN